MPDRLYYNNKDVTQRYLGQLWRQKLFFMNSPLYRKYPYHINLWLIHNGILKKKFNSMIVLGQSATIKDVTITSDEFFEDWFVLRWKK